MGIAAYNRGSQAISQQIARQSPVRDTAFLLMDRINALPKKQPRVKELHRGPRKPLLDRYAIQHDAPRGVWWMMDPDNMYEGHSRAYRSLEDTIASWDNLFLTGYDYSTDTWTAEVI